MVLLLQVMLHLLACRWRLIRLLVVQPVRLVDSMRRVLVGVLKMRCFLQVIWRVV